MPVFTPLHKAHAGQHHRRGGKGSRLCTQNAGAKAAGGKARGNERVQFRGCLAPFRAHGERSGFLPRGIREAYIAVGLKNAERPVSAGKTGEARGKAPVQMYFRRERGSRLFQPLAQAAAVLPRFP